MPLGVMVSCYALRFEKPSPQLFARVVKFGLYVAAPSILFTVTWQFARVGTVGHAVLVVGSAGVMAVLSEFTLSLVHYRFDVVKRQLRSAAAGRALAIEHNQSGTDTDVSSVDLDARLDYRYQQARKEAEAEVRQFLPANPRTAKRMINHVSLAMAIAEQRGLFRDPDITQRHLAKWIGISEQWPALGAALTTTPELMVALENAVDVAGLQTVLDDITPGTVASEDMLRRLGDGYPLGGLLDRIVRYEPRDR